MSQVQKICKNCVFVVGNICNLQKTSFPNRINGKEYSIDMILVHTFMCRGNWFLPRNDDEKNRNLPHPTCPP